MIDTFTTQKQWERSSGRLSMVLRDENSAPVLKADVTSLTLTLYDQATRAIINSRRAQPVLDANDVTMGASDGLITWAVSPADMHCSSSGQPAVHIAQFTCRWAAGAKEHVWTVLFPLENLPYL